MVFEENNYDNIWANLREYNITQKEKAYIKTNMIPTTTRFAFLDFSFVDSSILNTLKGDAYHVLNKGIKANITDMNTPKTIPISIDSG